jgi:hypothetical protein
MNSRSHSYQIAGVGPSTGMNEVFTPAWMRCSAIAIIDDTMLYIHSILFSFSNTFRCGNPQSHQIFYNTRLVGEELPHDTTLGRDCMTQSRKPHQPWPLPNPWVKKTPWNLAHAHLGANWTWAGGHRTHRPDATLGNLGRRCTTPKPYSEVFFLECKY